MEEMQRARDGGWGHRAPLPSLGAPPSQHLDIVTNPEAHMGMVD